MTKKGKRTCRRVVDEDVERRQNRNPGIEMRCFEGRESKEMDGNPKGD